MFIGSRPLGGSWAVTHDFFCRNIAIYNLYWGTYTPSYNHRNLQAAGLEGFFFGLQLGSYRKSNAEHP